MSWFSLSKIGDVLGEAAGGVSDFITNDIFGSADTKAVGNSGGPSGFFSPEFLSTALQGATSLASGLYANKAAEDEAKKNRQYELEKLNLQAKYGLLGNGGGGGSQRDAMLYKAYQDWLATRQANRENISQSLGALATGAQRALRR